MAGELALDGTIRPVQGTLAMAEAAGRSESEAIAVPGANAPEAMLAEGARVIPLGRLAELAAIGTESEPEPPAEPGWKPNGSGASGPDLADLRGQPYLRYGLERTDGKARGVVLIGSSLGAAFAARAASQEPKVVAIALVSPGAAIEGYDVYRPFSDVRVLPSFIAAAKDDNVSREPISALTQMAKEHATVKVYDGRGHGAWGLGQGEPRLFADLVDWLMSTYDAGTVERTIIPRGADDKKKGQR